MSRQHYCSAVDTTPTVLPATQYRTSQCSCYRAMWSLRYIVFQAKLTQSSSIIIAIFMIIVWWFLRKNNIAKQIDFHFSLPLTKKKDQRGDYKYKFSLRLLQVAEIHSITWCALLFFHIFIITNRNCFSFLSISEYYTTYSKTPPM